MVDEEVVADDETKKFMKRRVVVPKESIAVDRIELVVRGREVSSRKA